jgi:hypothetical protein
VQVGTYPTRNFALALTSELLGGGKRVLMCTRVLPACRHADGTISSSSVPDVRRMASEDSDQLSSGLLAIHRLRDLSDLHHALQGEVTARLDQSDALRELLEVASLRRFATDTGERTG